MDVPNATSNFTERNKRLSRTIIGGKNTTKESVDVVTFATLPASPSTHS